MVQNKVGRDWNICLICTVQGPDNIQCQTLYVREGSRQLKNCNANLSSVDVGLLISHYSLAWQSRACMIILGISSITNKGIHVEPEFL